MNTESHQESELRNDTAALCADHHVYAKALRMWPAWGLVVLMMIMRFVPKHFEGGVGNYWMFMVFGPLICSGLVFIWWLTVSRATWKERLLGAGAILVANVLVAMFLDSTMLGPAMIYWTIPLGMVLFVLGLTLRAQFVPGKRVVLAVGLAVLGFASGLFFRNEGMTGGYEMVLKPRWSPTAEEGWKAEHAAQAAEGQALPVLVSDGRVFENPEWPGFRGPGREGVVSGSAFETDWTAHPPTLLWRHAVGPAWSSFAVAGEWLFTQEQRGTSEAVVCYDASTGLERWVQSVEARFEEPLGGPGPRATPTLAEGGLFVLGAAGDLMRLDPATGERVWHQNLMQITSVKAVPMWGYSASPWVQDGVLVVHAGGNPEQAVLGFDAKTGETIWKAAAGDHSYSSPQGFRIGEEEWVGVLTNEGLRIVELKTGKEGLGYVWKCPGYRAIQPRWIGADKVLIPTGPNLGTRALRVTREESGEMRAEELWTSRFLKPDFSDFVIFEGHVYGFDTGIFTCVELEKGERRWKAGRYGKGQVVLLEKTKALLVMAETGKVVLVAADPDAHREIGEIQALEGKTWNHPALAGGRLFVRNAQEAACYQLDYK